MEQPGRKRRVIKLNREWIRKADHPLPHVIRGMEKEGRQYDSRAVNEKEREEGTWEFER